MSETRNGNGNGERAESNDRIVEKGKRQLLIAPRRGQSALRRGLLPMSAGAMKGLVNTLPGVDVVKVIKPKKQLRAMSVSADDATDVYVVRLDKDRAELLKQSAPPSMIVEEDHYLGYGAVVGSMRVSPQMAQPVALPGVQPQQMRFRVVDDAGKPIAGVKVTLTGDSFPSEGETDGNGDVQLDLLTLPGGRARALYLKPPHDYWDRFIVTPDLAQGDLNVVRLLSLSSSVDGFPGQFKYGWGQRLMGLDAMPSHVTGKGVKIAIIDSGADCTHPLLRHLQTGVDFTNNQDRATWATDTVGHGSHCAGVITARAIPGFALSGFAPEAEIHIFKIFPGGQFSSLLEALDECMARDIDIVNMSLGSDQPSQAVEQKLEECVLDGIACIVAAGNSGDAVQYPASSPNVLAVAALGKLKEFPSEAWDAQTVVPGAVTPEGLFSPSFTCFGPQVSVCAPGVAIISTVPNSGFEPESGTSMAAPHVTGLAALLLAHHPIFQTTWHARGPERVAALFNAIRSLCVPFPLPRERTGLGVPTLTPLLRVLQPALNGVTAAAAPSPSASAPAPRNAPAPAAAAAAPSAGFPNLGPLSAGPGQLPSQGLIGQQLAVVLQQLLQQLASNSAALASQPLTFQSQAGSAGMGGVPFPPTQAPVGNVPLNYPMFWAR